MVEIDDYCGDYFFNGEEEWLEYQSLLGDYNEPTSEEKAIGYNIFTLEQAISVINEIANEAHELSIPAESSIKTLRNFLKIYSETKGAY